VAELCGRYGQAGSPGLLIEETREGLRVRLPGAPEDSGTPLCATGRADCFEVGAPGAGAELRFHLDDAGTAVGLSLAGGLRLPRHPDPEPPDYVTGPRPTEDPSVLERFEALFVRDVQPGGGRLVDHDLGESRSQFLAFLCHRKKLLAHGSNTSDIERFEPRSRTLGLLREQSQSGVSACADALWAMAYAVIDRSRMRGSFQNAVVPFAGPSGSGRLYHFSIAQDTLRQSPPPFTDGTVYLFGREGFSRFTAMGAQLEWRADGAVRPLCRVRVSPEDFPLLDRIRGHDDGAARRHLELRDMLLGECTSASEHDDGYTLRFAPRPGLTRDVSALCRSMRRAYPWMDVRIQEPDGDAPLELSLRGSSGLRDVLGPRLRGKLRSR